MKLPTRAEALEVMTLRRNELTGTGRGSICVPATNAYSGTGGPWYPFDSATYPQSAIRSLSSPPWEDVCTVGRGAPTCLVPLDPFEPTDIRQTGLRIWDAAVGIPAADMRGSTPLTPMALTPHSHTNTAWLNEITYTLARVGNLDGSGITRRPEHTYIIDLTKHPLGWRLLEAAHGMAHRIAETPPPAITAADANKLVWSPERKRPGKSKVPAPTPGMFRDCLARLCVGLVYGIPIDVRPPNMYTPTCTQYGIHVVTSQFRAPVLQVPATSAGCPIPDESVAYVLAGVHTEPHPYGYTSGSGNYEPINMWSCSPTMVVIAGWELVDGITHQPLLEGSRYAKVPEPSYGMPAPALQSPDTFGAFLRMAVDARGEPVQRDGTVWDVEEWLASEDCDAAIGVSPPLPCVFCIGINTKTVGAPERPNSRRPEKARGAPKLSVRLSRTEAEWRDYDDKVSRIEHIIRDAVVAYECERVGGVSVNKRRKERMKAHRGKLKVCAAVAALNRSIERAAKNGQLTEMRVLLSSRGALVAQPENLLK